jgi:membrane protease YdiL (CAAX protease family)
MPAILDLVFVALLAVAWPIYEYFLDWPTFQRWLRDKPRHARLYEYRRAICVQWLLVAIGVALWLDAGRPWSALGLRAPGGWRLWVSSTAIFLFAAHIARSGAAVTRSPEKRARLRERIKSIGSLMPHTNREFCWFLALSLTAGVCEEFLFRGYFIWALSPWLSWWGAIALSALAFGLLHTYQGRNGVIGVALVGIIMSLVVAATRSLFPAIALHALMDAGNGLVIWIALREGPPQSAALEAPVGA